MSTVPPPGQEAPHPRRHSVPARVRTGPGSIEATTSRAREAVVEDDSRGRGPGPTRFGTPAAKHCPLRSAAPDCHSGRGETRTRTGATPYTASNRAPHPAGSLPRSMPHHEPTVEVGKPPRHTPSRGATPRRMQDDRHAGESKTSISRSPFNGNTVGCHTAVTPCTC